VALDAFGNANPPIEHRPQAGHKERRLSAQWTRDRRYGVFGKSADEGFVRSRAAADLHKLVDIMAHAVRGFVVAPSWSSSSPAGTPFLEPEIRNVAKNQDFNDIADLWKIVPAAGEI